MAKQLLKFFQNVALKTTEQIEIRRLVGFEMRFLSLSHTLPQPSVKELNKTNGAYYCRLPYIGQIHGVGPTVNNVSLSSYRVRAIYNTEQS